MSFYVGTQPDVQAYIDAINNHAGLPVNLPNGYQMLNWTEAALECEDGSFTVVKPPDALLIHHMGDSQETLDAIAAFRAAYVTGKLTEVETITLKIEEA